MKKIITSILAPLLSATMFFGCFGGGDKLTSANVKNLYNNYTSSYITTKNEQPFNPMFKNKLNITENKDFVVEGDYLKPTYEKIMYISFSDNYGLSAAVKNNDPSNKEEDLLYYQLTQIYQRLLSTIYNYYANHNESFYAFIEDEGVESKEINLLYKKLDNLNKVTDDLNKEIVSFENSLETIHKDIKRPIVLGRIPALYYKYNKVVDASLDFVNYFKDLHKKYIYKINHFDISVLENIEKEFASSNVNRYVDEALLLLAESVYYENVKAFEKNVVVENLHLLNTTYKNNHTNWVATEFFENLTLLNEDGFICANNLVKLSAGDEAAYGAVKDLYTHVASFYQNLQNYKKVYNSSNLDNYNQLRGFGEREDFKFDNLSVKEQSNLKFMEDFSTTKIPTLFNALYGVVNWY